ncbi:hypothetical protein ACWCXH_10955 [Kitasatospora sp. NPDC001660]
MKNAKLAAAVGVGYLLGRLHKARWALALAGMAAGKKLGAGSGAAVGQLIESSPQLRRVVDDVRGELASAGKKAAVAAAARRVGALTDQLEQRTEALRDANGHNEDEEPSDEEEAREESGGSAESRRTRSGASPRKSSSTGGSSRARTATERSGTRTSTRKSAAKAPPKKAAPRTGTARKTAASSAAKKTSAPARKTAGSRTSARKSG